LVKTKSYYKKIAERRRVAGTNIDAVLQQSVNQLYDNSKTDFEDEFNPAK
jgi:hypothetical protein